MENTELIASLSARNEKLLQQVEHLQNEVKLLKEALEPYAPQEDEYGESQSEYERMKESMQHEIDFLKDDYVQTRSVLEWFRSCIRGETTKEELIEILAQMEYQRTYGKFSTYPAYKVPTLYTLDSEEEVTAKIEAAKNQYRAITYTKPTL